MAGFSPAELRAILFDFGGTLDLNGIHWLNRFYRLYDEFNLDISQSNIKDAFYGADASMEELTGREKLTLEPMMDKHINFQFRFLGLKNSNLERCMVRRFCAEVRRNFEANRKLLQKLSIKYKLGVISNFYGNVSVICHEAGFGPYLDLIVDSQDVGIRKPDHKIFLMSVREMGLSSYLTAFVGDSFSQDIKPAKEVGMKTIWLKTEETAPFPDNWVDYVDLEIHSLHFLEGVLL